MSKNQEKNIEKNIEKDQNIKENPKQTDKIIVKYKGSQYDITNFVKKHPGGKKILLENNGQDIEQMMIDNEHSMHAYELLEKYKIQ